MNILSIDACGIGGKSKQILINQLCRMNSINFLGTQENLLTRMHLLKICGV